MAEQKTELIQKNTAQIIERITAKKDTVKSKAVKKSEADFILKTAHSESVLNRAMKNREKVINFKTDFETLSVKVISPFVLDYLSDTYKADYSKIKEHCKSDALLTICYNQHIADMVKEHNNDLVSLL